MSLSFREMDALVAQHVLGIDTVLECPAYRDPECGTWTIWWPELGEIDEFTRAMYTERILTYRPVPENDWREELPRYSMEMAAAWSVHLQMRGQILSKRVRYLENLQRIVSRHILGAASGTLIACPLSCSICPRRSS